MLFNRYNFGNFFHSIKANPPQKAVPNWIRSHPWFTAAGLISGWWIYKMLRRPRNLPPGPMSIPWLGGSWKLIFNDTCDTIDELERVYGNISSLYIGDQLHIFISTYDLIEETFLRRGDDFNTRRKEDLLSNLLEMNDLILSQTNNEEFKKNKDVVCAMLDSSDNLFNRPHIRATIEDMLINIYEKNETAFCPLNLLRRVCGASIMSIIMSKEYGLDDDELRNLIRLIGIWYDGLGTWNFLYYLLPFPSFLLKFLAKDTLEASRQVKQFVRESIKEHELCLDKKNPRDFIDYMLSEYEGKVDLNRIVDTIYVTFPDAIHTISFLVYLTLCYMAIYQEVQIKAQEYLDLVTKGNELILKHREQLAYVEAIILETLRISNMVPMITGHFPKKDSTLNGYNIPKSATVVGLLKNTHFNEKFFDEPRKFKPERFLNDQGNLLANGKKLLSFGIGQRMCIGKQISIKKSFLLTANILNHFKITTKQHSSLSNIEEFEREIMSQTIKKTEIVFKPRSS